VIKKKLPIILGSKNDELTSKLLKNFEKDLINYILIDYEKFKIFYSLNKVSINIERKFSGNSLLKQIKRFDNGIKPKRDCVFLFEFRSGFNKNILEYKLSSFVKKNNFQRFFYNRRSFNLIYFITDDFFGLNTEISKDKKTNKDNKLIISKLNGVRNFKLKFDPLMKSININKNTTLIECKKYLKVFFYILKFMHYTLLIYLKKNSKIKSKRKIFFICPKDKNYFLIKTMSKFSSLKNLLPIIGSLSKYYDLIICIHPKNTNSWFNILLKFWGIDTVTSIYSKYAREVMSNSHLVLTLGSTSVVESLLSSKATIEIGKIPRVTNFKVGYYFLKEDNLTLDKIKSSIEKMLRSRQKGKFNVPNFFSVFYPNFKSTNKGLFVKNTGSRSLVSNLEIKYLKNFFLKQLKIKK